MDTLHDSGWLDRRVGLMLACALSLVLLYCGQAIAQTCKPTTILASTPSSDFIDNGNGTLTHTKTGLMWKRCSEGQTWNGTTCTGAAATYTWSAALGQAVTLNNAGGFAGFSDWRAPNLKELASIVEAQCYYPAINLTMFPATVNLGVYWSATPSVATGTKAWAEDFSQGGPGVYLKSSAHELRLVRGGL